MQKSDNIWLYALPRLAEGVHKAARIVGATMGAQGVNVVLEHKQLPKHLLLNDGATIIDAIELADPIEQIGLSFLKEAVARSNNNSGDGSSTTTILLSKILEEGIKSGVSTLEIKRSLEECLPIIEKSLREQSKEITPKDIKMVATIAGEDEEVAGVLQEIYEKIGKDGIIHLENSGTFETNYHLIEGVRFIDTGYLSPYMVHDDEAVKRNEKPKKAVYHNPTILVTKNKISHLNDINPLLAALEQQGKKDLVIFTDDMDSGVARILIEAHTKGILNILIIKAPTLWKSYVFEDFAKCVGAVIIEDSTGTKLGKELRTDWLGTCETLICDKEETTLIGIKDISDHIVELKKMDDTDSKRRLSWLTTKTAILKLGAKSETELSYRRYKTEDAIFSSRAALRGGIVQGGGIALKIASETMLDTIGGKVLKEALKAPINQICANMGIEVPEKFGDEIVDSTEIVLNAVKNSLGIAATMLTTSSVITLPPTPLEQLANQQVMRPAYF